MAKKMLIDATHPEEMRVAIIDGQKLDDYEAEIETRKQTKSNIYLAKIIRVEPSLQAAFVEYGQDRHGFLPFSEIHPDYYQIPIADRKLLEKDLEKQQEMHAAQTDLTTETIDPTDESSVPSTETVSTSSDSENGLTTDTSSIDPIPETPSLGNEVSAETFDIHAEDGIVLPRPRFNRYKIQEVIKRRQIILVQVVKEERGNKGAALTTYLSLPGRYCVLMPNAGHRSGGISRKIVDSTDRKRLREILQSLPIPESMSLIVRTAGQNRNKLEIRRDFEYLLRLWGEIREKTLSSIAPALIYAEGDIIKRNIRDRYGKGIDEIIIEGEEGYKEARHFMRTLIPSHVKRIKRYMDEKISLFQHFTVEEQIDSMMLPQVLLPSGGSIVITPTEALVAVDVNSGRSTRERHIDETALKTNLEAADEVVRQMRLRDLGGLIVIDFIDMVTPKHIQAVEKRLRDAVQGDRARIQMGRISQFGLLEMSRQRLRPSVFEANMAPCTHCEGLGTVRSVESMALHILRGIETAAIKNTAKELMVTVPAETDFYLLNQKRSTLVHLESRYDIIIHIVRGIGYRASQFNIEPVSAKSAHLTRKPAALSETSSSRSQERPSSHRTPVTAPSEKKSPSVQSLEERTAARSHGAKVPAQSAVSSPDQPTTSKTHTHQRRRHPQKPASETPAATPGDVLEATSTAHKHHQEQHAAVSTDATSSSTPEDSNKTSSGSQNRSRRRRYHHRQRPRDTSSSASSDTQSPAPNTPAQSGSAPQTHKPTPRDQTSVPSSSTEGRSSDEATNGNKEKAPQRRRGWLKRLLETS